MNRTIHRRPEVSADIIDLAEYIARDSLEVALRFFDATEATIRGLAEMPGKGSLREFENSQLANVRSHPVDGFPNHWIFYESTDQTLLILASCTARGIFQRRYKAEVLSSEAMNPVAHGEDGVGPFDRLSGKSVADTQWVRHIARGVG